MSNFHGVLAVLCTPFYPDETIDYNSLQRLADYVIAEGRALHRVLRPCQRD